MSDHPAKPAPLRGWPRWRELQAQRAVQREQIAAGLLAGLGREPGEADRVAAKTIAAMQVEAERLESLGKSALEQRRIVAQLLRQSGFRPAPAVPQKPVDPSANAVEWLNSFKKPSTDAPPSDRTAVAAPSHARTSGPASGHSVDGAV